MSEHNPFGAFGVVDPAIATERTGIDLLKSMLERRAPSPPFSETTDIWMVADDMSGTTNIEIGFASYLLPLAVLELYFLAQRS